MKKIWNNKKKLVFIMSVIFIFFLYNGVVLANNPQSEFFLDETVSNTNGDEVENEKTSGKEKNETRELNESSVEMIPSGDYQDNEKKENDSTESEDSEPTQLLLKSVSTSSTNSIKVSYRAHVQSIGWQDWCISTNDGIATSGTSGQALRMEALEIKTDRPSLGVSCQAHVQKIGWQDWSVGGNTNSAVIGTTGESLRMEALKLRLTGTDAGNFDVYYRVHVQKYGWLDWAKNGESAGSEGFSLRVEAVQIVIVSKNAEAPGIVERPFLRENDIAQIQYRTHVQSIGWQDYYYDGLTAGTTGQAKRCEALQVKLNTTIDGGINTQACVQDIGWQDWCDSNEIAGTTGRALSMEAVKIKLTGHAAEQYDVYYRCYCQKYGWLDWAKNGESAGTSGYGYRMEAIQILLVNKNGAAPGSTSMPYVEKKGRTVENKVHTGDLGIDVSYWQHGIDWSAVSNSGVRFAIVRLGYGHAGDGQKDSYFEQNYSGAVANKIPVGAYLYSYAETKEDAAKEADFAISILDGRKLDLPVAFDVEEPYHRDNFSTSELTDIIVTFCNKIKAAGYTPMVYSYYNLLNNHVDFSRINDFDVWMANFASTTDFPKRYDIWQYSSQGSVNGISGYVDLNKSMKDY